MTGEPVRRRGWWTAECAECAGHGWWRIGTVRRLRASSARKWLVSVWPACRPRRCRFCNGTGRTPAFPAARR